LFNFLIHEYKYFLEHFFRQKKFPEETWPKIYLGQDPDLNPEQDPDPDGFKSRIRIRSKIAQIRNTDFYNDFEPQSTAFRTKITCKVWDVCL
jgi:hypothetical protein